MGHTLSGRTGDVTVTLQVIPHELYLRDSNHLIVYLPVDFITALVGGTLHFRSITKEMITVKIPPNTKNEQTIRIARKGVVSEKRIYWRSHCNSESRYS